MEKQNNKPVLRFPEFTGEWVKKRFGDFVSPKSQKYNPEKETESHKCIELEHLATETGLLLGFVDSINSGSIKNKFQKGDVLFGKLRPYLKKYLQAPFDGVCSSEIWVLKGISVSNEFLYRMVQTEQFVELANQSSGSKMPRADWDVVSSGVFSIPTLSEQIKIATFLKAVDDRLNQLKQKKTLLEQYKKGVQQKVFDQEIRFKDDDGDEFPDWEEKYGNFIFESISDKNHNSDLPILAITQEFGAIPRDLIDFNISVTDKSVESYKVVQVGDFIISLRSFQGGIEFSNYKGICSPAYIILRSIIEIDENFYKYYFKTESYIKLLNLKLEGIRDGKMISYKYFSDIKLPFPCVAEQTKIASFISAIDEKIYCCTEQISKTEQYKKGLLQQMFV